ncbi:MAG: hypothetical protein PHX13_11340 [Thiovulaceae bacterium]|nr:hypothetical protein [Sulfurimonadaceae bacterium]
MNKESYFILQRTYIIALAVLIAWSTFAYYISEKIVRDQETYVKLINLSQKQCMLSQRTALYASYLYVTPSQKNRELLSGLLVSVKNDNHEIIENITSQNVRDFYTKKEGLEEQLESYIVSLDTYMQRPSVIKLALISAQSEELLPILNQAVTMFQGENTLLVNKAKQMTFYIYIATLFTLLAITWFFFRAMSTRQIKDELE